MSPLRLAWRWFLRDWRSGELALLLAALTLAAAAVATVDFFAEHWGVMCPLSVYCASIRKTICLGSEVSSKSGIRSVWLRMSGGIYLRKLYSVFILRCSSVIDVTGTVVAPWNMKLALARR